MTLVHAMQVQPNAPRRPVLSHAVSLSSVDLGALRPLSARVEPVELDRERTAALFAALRRNSDAAVERLVARLAARLPGAGASDAERVGTALYHLLTNKRFRKGPRAHFPVEAAIRRARPFVADGAPIPVILQGFPFKQYDNRLKAAGPLPDLADAGAILRVAELCRAFAALYPPSLDITVMLDGGYYRPRREAELGWYRNVLGELEDLLGVPNTVHWRDKRELIATAVGPARWAEREAQFRRYRWLISALLRPAAATGSVRQADRLLRAATPDALPDRIPTFGAMFRSLLYSVPVPAPDHPAVPAWEWSRQVLSDVCDTAGGPAALRNARRRVLATAWQETIYYLAVCAADRFCRVDDALPNHVRLRTGLAGAEEIGFTYLGGSALLPWHGTGCVNERGQVAVDFNVVLRDRGFVPVHSDVTGPDQPLVMVPPQFVAATAAGRGLRRDFLAGIRLRPR
ncbi:L-tyrosine/L-tryptophan isonitrile synthase family protein [Gandjariella thermophila]|uniref:Pyoverdine/dityrosine biosynthesis protein n=1 Tax=Gandjariella thermophila TaxID=1931992 RepID=A0A4D4J9G8_9PSEU|nr:L-tyrosine/L-tryptophan isonitrile synthase family protein [Gandjariella thermophila]GDY31136.1 hypothetical protein GTS_27690 [Gandjariella thermophila]